MPSVPCLPRSYNKTAKKIVGKGGLRWYKNVGLGFRTPKEAIEGEPGNSCSGVGTAAPATANVAAAFKLYSPDAYITACIFEENRDPQHAA